MLEDDGQPVSTVAAGFSQYDDYLKLDPDERDSARDMHHEIRDSLRAAGVIADAFLQGPLARKTMLAPLRDIDMVVIMAAPTPTFWMIRMVPPRRWNSSSRCSRPHTRMPW